MDAQCSLPGHYFPYEFVPWAFTVREVWVLCVFRPSHVKPKFSPRADGRAVALRETARHLLARPDVRAPATELSTSGNSNVLALKCRGTTPIRVRGVFKPGYSGSGCNDVHGGIPIGIHDHVAARTEKRETSAMPT